MDAGPCYRLKYFSSSLTPSCTCHEHVPRASTKGSSFSRPRAAAHPLHVSEYRRPCERGSPSRLSFAPAGTPAVDVARLGDSPFAGTFLATCFMRFWLRSQFVTAFILLVVLISSGGF